MLQDVVEGFLYEDAEMNRDLEPMIPLPLETKRISVNLQSNRLEKLAIPMIAANKLYPHLGPQFNHLPLLNRSAFFFMVFILIYLFVLFCMIYWCKSPHDTLWFRCKIQNYDFLLIDI